MFKSVESALSWAFNQVATVPVKSSAVHRMCGKPSRGTSNSLLIGLNQDERMKQAANIIGMVESLSDPACRELIFAEFGYERDDDLMKHVMIRAMVVVGTGVEKRRRGVRDIVLTYFGENIGQRKIRDDLKCNRNNVHIHVNKVHDELDRIRSRAIDTLHQEMINAGLVESARELVCA